MTTPITAYIGRRVRLWIGVSIVLALSARPIAQMVDRRPTLRVRVQDRSSTSATELGTARTRASFLFAETGIRIAWMTRGEALSVDNARSDRIELVVLGGPAADDVFAGRRSVLGFAIPSASRVYVHYDRVHALARHRRVQPGWFLGLVIAHELAHVLLPEAGHSERGVMAPLLSPDPKVPPTFTDDEAQWIRARLLGEAIVARLRFP